MWKQLWNVLNTPVVLPAPLADMPVRGEMVEVLIDDDAYIDLLTGMGDIWANNIPHTPSEDLNTSDPFMYMVGYFAYAYELPKKLYKHVTNTIQ